MSSLTAEANARVHAMRRFLRVAAVRGQAGAAPARNGRPPLGPSAYWKDL
jgi:hypothetical protein